MAAGLHLHVQRAHSPTFGHSPSSDSLSRAASRGAVSPQPMAQLVPADAPGSPVAISPAVMAVADPDVTNDMISPSPD